MARGIRWKVAVVSLESCGKIVLLISNNSKLNLQLGWLDD